MSIARIALLLFSLTFVSRFLGVLREIVIAWEFGVSSETDAFFLAFSLPWAFYAIVGTALTSVVVPILSDIDIKHGQKKMFEMVSIIINQTILFVSIAAVIVWIFSEPIIVFMGNGFDAITRDMANTYIAILLPSLVLMSLTGVLGGALNKEKIFGAPAWGPVLMNAVIIIFALFGGFLSDIKYIVYGTLIGSIVFVFIQIPSLRKIGYVHLFEFGFSHPEIKKIGRMMWPVMVISAVGFSFTVIDYRYASQLGEGVLSSINYATKLIQLPQGIFVMAVATAIFPLLSKHGAEDNLYEMGKLLSKGIRYIAIIAVPGSIGFIIVSKEIVALFFERGAFDDTATAITSDVLTCLAIGLVASCLSVPLIRAFYALVDSKTPMYAGMASVFFKAMCSYVLMDQFGYIGLPTGTVIAVIINVVILSYFLNKKLKFIDTALLSFFGLIVFSSVIMGGVVFYLINLGGVAAVLEGFPAILRLSVIAATGVLVFGFVARCLKISELDDVLHMINKKFGFCRIRQG